MKRLLKYLAIRAYWKAKTPAQERRAYFWMRKLGFPASYGEIE